MREFKIGEIATIAPCGGDDEAAERLACSDEYPRR